jgi:DNA mismatch repair ATPase MutS
MLLSIDLMRKNILSAEDNITLLQTEIMNHPLDQRNGVEGEEVVFLYRIVPLQGPSVSHGIWCAGIAGIPSHTIERGKKVFV